MWSSFVYAGNRPIVFIDVNGMGPGDPVEDPSFFDDFMDFNFKSYLDLDDNSASGYGLGLFAGIGDGILETIQSAAGMGEAAAYLNPFTFSFYTDEGEKYRDDLQETVQALYDVLSTEEGRAQLYELGKEMLGEYWDDLTFGNSTTEAGYAHGKILFEVLIAVATAGGSTAATGTKGFLKAAKEGGDALTTYVRKTIADFDISIDKSAFGQLNSGIDPSKLVKIKKKAQGGASESIRDMMRSQKVVKTDMMDKGVHFNVGKIELRAVPDHQGGITFKPVHPAMAKKNQGAYQKAVKEGTQSLGSSEFRSWLSKHAQKGMEMAQESGNAKALEFKFLLNALKAME